jgi:hypothetical protein
MTKGPKTNFAQRATGSVLKEEVIFSSTPMASPKVENCRGKEQQTPLVINER